MNQIQLTPQVERQAGFSLVELMVGLVIGILAMLVILQLYQVFEGQKRTTTSGSDAQESGLFALTTLERDIKMAGVGITTRDSLSCANLYSFQDTGAGAPGPITNFSTAPITITDGGVNSDSLIIRSSASNLGSAPVTLRATKPQTSSEFDVNSVANLRVNDLVLLVQGGNCMVVQLTQLQPTARKVQHNPGGNASLTSPVYNPNGSCFQANGFCASWPAFTAGALIYSLGAQPDVRSYSVSNTSTLNFVLNNAPPVVIATDIVYMKAQYGIALPAGPGVDSQTIIGWVDATNIAAGNTAGNWAAPSPASIRQIKAVRIAVVARSLQQERTNAAGIPGIATATPLPLWPADTMTAGKTMTLTLVQQQFRYRVYQTIIPLRNVLWANI